MKTKKSFLIFWLIFTAVITYMSLSTSFAPPAKYNLDKVAHFGANFIIAFVPALYFRKIFTLYCITIGAISLGIFIEIMQTNIVGREGSIGDVIANSLGVISAIFIAYKINQKKQSQKKQHKHKASPTKIL